MNRKWAVGILFFLILTLIFQGIIPTPFTDENRGLIYSERESQLSSYSTDWNGLSVFRKHLEAQGDYEIQTLVSNPLILTKLPEPEKTLLVITGVEKRYDPIQAQEIVDFTKQGGKILLMDDFGKANSLASKFGITFTGKHIWSLDYDKNNAFIKRQASFDGEQYNLLFNLPTVLNRSSTDTIFNQEALLNTTRETWIDDNRNGTLDMYNGDAQREDTLIMEGSLDREAVVLCIGDASLFINDMLARPGYDNKDFSLAVVKHLLGNGTIIFDESRHIQGSTVDAFVYNFANGYVYIIHIFFVSETDSETLNVIIQVVQLAVICLFAYVGFLFYAATKLPKRLRSRYDPTYHVKYEFGGMGRQTRLYYLINSAIQDRYGLIFVDAEHVYDEENRELISIRNKKILKDLLGDPVLEKFYLKPQKEYTLDKITQIYHHVMNFRDSE